MIIKGKQGKLVLHFDPDFNPYGCIAPGIEVKIPAQTLFFSELQNPLSWTEPFDPDVMSLAE